MNKRFLTISGSIITLIRIITGFYDGSALLILFGLWSGYTILEALLGFPFFFLKSGDSFKVVPEFPPRLNIPAVYLRPILMIFLSTIILGIGISNIKEFFQIYMGVRTDFPGTTSMLMIMVTGIIWEGGLLLLFTTAFDIRIMIRLHLLNVLLVFTACSTGFFFSGRFYLLEPAGSFIFGVVFFVRIMGKLLLMAPGFLGE